MASRGPQPATTPVGNGQVGRHPLPVAGERTRPPRRSRSAGSSPRATARTCGEDGARAMGMLAPPGCGVKPHCDGPRTARGGVGEGRIAPMVTLRPMTDADVPGAVHAFDSGFLAMRARYGLPMTASSLQNDRRRQNRTRHFLATDPGGSWVAEDDGVIVGMSQSFVREGYWVLSQLGAVPGRQGRGIGRELLRLAHSHGDPRARAPSSAPAIPRPWPSTPIWGSLSIRWWPPGAPCGRERCSDRRRWCATGEGVTDAQLDVVARIDRAVRGSARPVDITMMLSGKATASFCTRTRRTRWPTTIASSRSVP